MRPISLVTALFLLSSLSPASAGEPCGDGTMLFEDDFDALDAGWGQTPAAVSVEDGNLRISLPPSGYLFLTNSAVMATDADLCAKVTTVSSAVPDETVVGVVFWRADDQDFFLFEISPNGTAGFFHMEGGRPIPLAPWQPFAGIKAGDGAVNLLRVTTTGDKATVSVNDQKFAEAEGKPPANGQSIGLAASSPSSGRSIYMFDFVRADAN